MFTRKPSGAVNQKRQLQLKRGNENFAELFAKYFQLKGNQSEFPVYCYKLEIVLF